MLNEVAQRYSEALFSLAKDNQTLEVKKSQAEVLLQLLEENPELAGFFRAVKISKSEKKDFIETTLSAQFDREMVNFLKLLIDKGRMSNVQDILKVFIHKANEEMNIQEAYVYSARKLKAEDLERIQKALEVKSGKQVILKNRIDPSLLAGIKVVVGNQVTDVTMKHKMDKLRETLLKGGGLA